MHSAAGEYARSLELQRRRLQLSREIGYRRGEAISTGNLGLAMAILGQLDESIELHQRQVTLCREIGHKRGEAAGLLSLASAKVARLRFEEAEGTCREGMELAQAIGATSVLASGEQMLGDILHALGRPDEAKEHFDAAQQKAGEAGIAVESVIAVLLAAQLPGGDAENARRAYESHRDRLPLRVRMHAEHLMYRLTKDRAHLDAAWERLTHLRDNAPPEYRESMMRNQPMHAAIVNDVEAGA
jgi:tetratricopeptide (TPR) repeat protein